MSSNSDLPEEKEKATPNSKKNMPSMKEAKKPIIFQKDLKEKLEKTALTQDAEVLSQFVLKTMAAKPKK